jgi:hypothetical protein
MFIAVSDGVQSNTSRQPLEQSVDVFIHPTVASAVPPRPVDMHKTSLHRDFGRHEPQKTAVAP